MKTLDRLIEASTEFVYEQWGRGEASLMFFAPVTRDAGTVWTHPTWAREYTWDEITRKATRIWRVRGSLWNAQEYSLVWTRDNCNTVVDSAGAASQRQSTAYNSASGLDVRELGAAA